MRLWDQPARQLPVTQSPVPGETVVSYLHRLADANHFPLTTLIGYLARCTNLPGVWRRDDAQLNPAAIDRLAAISGLSPDCLERALPALSVPLVTATTGPRMRRITSHPSLGPFTPCFRCLARRGVTTLVFIHLPIHLHLCVQHAIWLRSHEPRPLSNTPELLQQLARAQRHHQRLQRRYGPDPARRVYQRAERIVRDWLLSRWHVDLRIRWDQRRRSLGLSEQVIDDAELLLVTYPEAVTLAGLLASPYWLSKVGSRRRDSWKPFLDEAGRRLGISYRSHIGASDPLAGWILGRRQRESRRRPPDPLELAGLPESLVMALRRISAMARV
jgi:hypothetical protein